MTAKYSLTQLVGSFILFFTTLTVSAQSVLRGEVRVDLEPVYYQYIDEPYPLDTRTAQIRALQEGSLYFASMIFGWVYDYEIGEKARAIPEQFDLTSRGTIPAGDPKLLVTDARLVESYLYVWMDYRPDAAQERRLEQWKSGTIKKVQATGNGPLAGPGAAGWLDGKRQALEDAARAAVRTLLRGTERNRPKHSTGLVALASFPRYWVDAGRWQCGATFYIEVSDITAFSAY
ncbi:hypothetical protein [Gracilinema caldarium]|uniref:Uncharacterized protein n=1 Tax=Gracilinema caldarium (strain ATCC 51460 / DSM 7334 / H1) TaxID=744872 RepID=F8EWU1_GRAC1|nr:hypothetical protein [Gracilinema caldarium]AEJ18327.1 hypothetical protein Spica_0159 [Gracilinema caldarium DSM 7334]